MNKIFQFFFNGKKLTTIIDLGEEKTKGMGKNREHEKRRG